MIRKFFVILCISILNVAAFAQINHTYEWDSPQYSPIETEFANENQIIVFEKKIVEYYFEKSTGYFKQLNVLHKKVQVNSEDAISGYSKLYLPTVTQSKSLEFERARVITKDGKVRELDKSAIKTSKDEETKREYNYLAFEGVEKGSQIEYFFVTIQNPDYKGTSYFYQSDVVKQEVDFTLIAPANLKFVFKSLNNAFVPIADTLITDYIMYKANEKNVAKLKDEPWAMYDVNLKQIHYKLHENTSTGKSNIVNYGELSQILYTNIYTKTQKNDTKAIEKLIKNAGVLSTDSLHNKVFKIEHYLKKNIGIVSNSVSELEVISNALKNKMTTEFGMVTIMANTYKQLGIAHELVLTSDRTTKRFDEKFESYDFLEHYLIYFPEIDLFLDPTEIYYRLGLIPAKYTANNGLFIKEVSAAGIVTGVGKIKNIPAPSREKCFDKLRLNVKFSSDLLSNSMTMRKENFGYYANSYQPYFEILSDDVKKEVQEEIVKYISKNIEIVSMQFENANSEFIARKPLIANAEITSTEFIQKAGNKILFKVGDLIGPQAEMYNVEKRVLPVENDFNRTYYRVLTIEIPEGYKIENLQDIIINKSVVESDGSISSKFTSNYTLQGNILTITVDEWYNQIYYPIEKFEDYRAVINAAADFNKVVFVLVGK